MENGIKMSLEITKPNTKDEKYIIKGKVILIESHPATYKYHSKVTLTLQEKDSFQTVYFFPRHLTVKQANLFLNKKIVITLDRFEYENVLRRDVSNIKLQETEKGGRLF